MRSNRWWSGSTYCSPKPTVIPGRASSMPCPASLRAQPSGGALLAQAMVVGNVVLGRGGIDAAASPSADSVRPEAAPEGSRIAVGRPVDVVQFDGLLPSLPEVSAVASGHGLASNRFDDGVVRTMPLLGGVGGALMPLLAMAMLQQVTRRSEIGLESDRFGLRRVTLESLTIPVNRDGSFNPLSDGPELPASAGEIEKYPGQLHE